jgi:hypothetical protein
LQLTGAAFGLNTPTGVVHESIRVLRGRAKNQPDGHVICDNLWSGARAFILVWGPQNVAGQAIEARGSQAGAQL